jgi:DNA (cytosine-5)-methyltransferase 1
VGRWGVIGANDCGAPHKRKRLWIVAHSRRVGHRITEDAICPGRYGTESGSEVMADTDSRESQERRLPSGMGRKWITGSDEDSRVGGRNVWPPEPGVGRMAHGVAARVDRLRTLGNGQVPAVAAAAWRALT